MIDKKTGKKRRGWLYKLGLEELSFVNDPANPLARVTIHKTAEIGKRDYSQEQRDAMAGHEAMSDGSFPIKDRADLMNALRSIGRAKSYDAAKKHIISRARAMGMLDALPDEWKVSKVWGSNDELPSSIKNSLPSHAQSVFREVANKILESGGSEESAMAQAWTAVKNGWKRTDSGEWVRKEVGESEMMEAEIQELKKQLTDATARADKAEADLVKAVDAARVELEAELKKAREDEMLEYGDQKIRKSEVGASVFAVLKSERAEREAITKKLELAEIRKTVDAEFPRLVGTSDEKAAFYKLVLGMPEAERKIAEAILKGANAAMNDLLKEQGHRRSGTLTGSTEEKIEKGARELQKSKGGITYEAAYTEFLKTSDGRALYEESLRERPTQAN